MVCVTGVFFFYLGLKIQSLVKCVYTFFCLFVFRWGTGEIHSVFTFYCLWVGPSAICAQWVVKDLRVEFIARCLRLLNTGMPTGPSIIWISWIWNSICAWLPSINDHASCVDWLRFRLNTFTCLSKEKKHRRIYVILKRLFLFTNKGTWIWIELMYKLSGVSTIFQLCLLSFSSTQYHEYLGWFRHLRYPDGRLG